MKQLRLPYFYIYLFGLAVMAIGLPFGKALMSISQMIIGGNWILEGNYREKLKTFWQNRTAVVLCSIFFLNLIGLIHTDEDMQLGLSDTRIKAPLFILPFVIATSAPLSIQWFRRLMLLFASAVIAKSLWSIANFYGLTGNHIVDMRQVTGSLSHIRFSLMACVAVFSLAYFLYYERSMVLRLFFFLGAAWLIVFLFIIESLTGIMILAFVSFVLSLYFIFILKNRRLKFVILLALAGLFAWAAYFIYDTTRNFRIVHYEDKTKLEQFTKKGHPYFHDTLSDNRENGYLVWIYISEEELKEEWSKRSRMDFEGTDLKGNGLRYTIIRFMASKGLRKDAEGMQRVSDPEIRMMESGIPNVNFSNISGPRTLVYRTFWELNHYLKGGNPTGHSITMRFEFWKAATGVIKDNWLFGVGTGDIEQAFFRQYEKMKSPLSRDWWLRSHNQFLNYGVMFGIFGMAWFIFFIFYPLIRERKWTDYFYITFFLVAFLSFLNEDTLETQDGATFFAFFNSIFLFREKLRE